MLQRAASNAYSWWWASHIRTKQTKWVEQNLQDMDEKVAQVLKILEEEGDSFARRAEMYYKRRPELISFVEETYKAYRALAERYDHISIELQKANNQLAVACPDRVPYMDEDEDDGSPRPPRKMPDGSKQNIPKPPSKDLKTVVTVAAATKKLQSRKPPSKGTNNTAATPTPKSGLSRKEAIEEVDKLQKQILALQTVKEFVKSSYDNSIARYWETEGQINELQERVSMLQEELGEGVVIEDNEARRLMAEAALKSCEEALTQLEVKQEQSHDETRMTSSRIKDVKAKLGSLMDEFNYTQSDSKEPRAKRDMKKASETKDSEEEESILKEKREELQSLKNNIKEQFQPDSDSSLSVAEMAEKIDELVNKVISLETAVSSQTALVTTLRTETDELQEHIRTLEGDKESLINDKSRLNDQLREMEEKMHRVQDLNKTVEDENSSIQTQFTEARSNLGVISEKVQNEMHFEEVKATDLSQPEKNASGKPEPEYEPEKQVPLNDVMSDKELKVPGLVEDGLNSDMELKVGTAGDLTSDKKLEVIDSTENVVCADNKLGATGSLENDVTSRNEVKFTSAVETECTTTVENTIPEEFKEQDTNNENQISQQASNKADISFPDLGKQDSAPKEVSSNTEYTSNAEARDEATTKEDEPDWRGMFLSGLQDREKILLTEYTNTLRSYKDLKKRLADIETKTQDDDLDQLKKLEAANALKDEEIRLLRQKLSLLDRSLEGTEDSTGSTVLQSSIEELLETRLQYTSPIEEKFRARIDELLDENLKCWREFGASFEDVQRFETTIKDLMTEVTKIEIKAKALEGTSGTKYSLKSDARPIYQHLTETQNLLTAWLERSVYQNEELERRFSCLCNIQEDITSALRTSAEDDDFRFTSYQAAKFQGEVLTLKQEHTKFSGVLRTHVDIVRTLHHEVEKALVRLNDQFGLSASRRGTGPETRNKVPLRSFIFGNKPKKQSIFTIISMHPGLHKKRGSKEKEREKEEKKEKDKEKKEKEKEKVEKKEKEEEEREEEKTSV